MYSIQPLEGGKKATAKGIDGRVKDEIITHSDYKNSLFNEEQMTHKWGGIQQESHQLYTMELEKKSLSPFNDKKWITREGNNSISLSYGHYKIK